MSLPATLLLDLDCTLYPESNGLWAAIKNRIDVYLVEVMGWEPELAKTRRVDFLQRYGTTLRGLQVEYNISADEYLAFVHDLPIADYIAPDPALARLLSAVHLPKAILTNSDHHHARRVLRHMGMQDLFPTLIDIYALNFISKPDAQAYQIALENLGNPAPGSVLFVDDSLHNVAGAIQAGFKGVWINPFNKPAPDRMLHIPSLHHLPEIYPHFWPTTEVQP